MLFGAVVGVISGQYIFKEPLQEYWREQRLQQQDSTANNFQDGAKGQHRKSDSD
jgi:hypothetical protein